MVHLGGQVGEQFRKVVELGSGHGGMGRTCDHWHIHVLLLLVVVVSMVRVLLLLLLLVMLVVTLLHRPVHVIFS